MNKWKEAKLINLCNKITVGHVGSMAGEYVSNGIPFLRSQNIKPYHVDHNNMMYVDIAFHEKLKKSALQSGDVAVVRTGYPGTACVIPPTIGEANCSDLVIIRPGSELNPHYLAAIFNSEFGKGLVAGNLVGAAQQHFNVTVAKEMKLKFPPIGEQNKIAAILSAYDDLIENNKRRVTLLENMAEEIYREWFVRFRFPGYQTAEFEKGIPKGWSLERIDSLGKVITGKTPSTKNSKYYGGEIPFVKTPDMHGNMFVYQTDELLTEDGLNSQPSQILEKNAICVSCIGTGGVVSMTTQTCSTNQQINSLRLNTVTDREWAFFTLKALKPTILAFGATGATMTNLSKGKFAGIKAIIPKNELRLEFSSIINPMFEQIQFLSMLNNNLNDTKLSLLPRLISGKLSVKDLDIQFPSSMQEDGTA
jgi:type I restriction enzyme S subunit